MFRIWRKTPQVYIALTAIIVLLLRLFPGWSYFSPFHILSQFSKLPRGPQSQGHFFPSGTAISLRSCGRASHSESWAGQRWGTGRKLNQDSERWAPRGRVDGPTSGRGSPRPMWDLASGWTLQVTGIPFLLRSTINSVKSKCLSIIQNIWCFWWTFSRSIFI